MKSIGFNKKSHDHTLFTKAYDGIFMAVLVYVDDIVIANNSDDAADLTKDQLQSHFKLCDLGLLKYFLGLEIARSKEDINVCQRKYDLELLNDTNMLGCKPSSIPIEPNQRLSKDDGDIFEDVELYRRLIGKLIYLTITRPDLCFSVQKLAKFTYAPRVPHYQALMKVLRYIKGTLSQGLFIYANSSLELKGFADANWVTCPDTRKSITGYCIFFGDSLIS